LNNADLRVRCRNQKCRSKLTAPTDNEHKAFCTPYCYTQFYFWKCKVCEKPILKGRRRKQPDHCHDHRCRKDFRRYPDAFSYTPSQKCALGVRSAHFAGVKSAIDSTVGPRIVAGAKLSEFSLWAATLDPPKQRPVDRPAWCLQRQPGDLAAVWAAAEWARRETEDEQYVAKDEERLRTTQPLSDGNYPTGGA
jgi:hypothetical protein